MTTTEEDYLDHRDMIRIGRKMAAYYGTVKGHNQEARDLCLAAVADLTTPPIPVSEDDAPHDALHSCRNQLLNCLIDLGKSSTPTMCRDYAARARGLTTKIRGLASKVLLQPYTRNPLLLPAHVNAIGRVARAYRQKRAHSGGGTSADFEAVAWWGTLLYCLMPSPLPLQVGTTDQWLDRAKDNLVALGNLMWEMGSDRDTKVIYDLTHDIDWNLDAVEFLLGKVPEPREETPAPEKSDLEKLAAVGITLADPSRATVILRVLREHGLV